MTKEVEVLPAGTFKDLSGDEHKFLFKNESIQRAKDVSDVSYKLALALIRGGKTFHGHVLINFSLNSQSAASDGIFVDYHGEKVHSLHVNGKQVMEGSPYRDHRIYFPKEMLKEGANSVSVTFESYYVKDCQGMHYFMDKEDGEEYLYTQFEAANAHCVFPCFD